MNLENFNLGKFIFSNETKNFISEFINELAKTLYKERNMNLGVVYGFENEIITLLRHGVLIPCLKCFIRITFLL